MVSTSATKENEEGYTMSTYSSSAAPAAAPQAPPQLREVRMTRRLPRSVFTMAGVLVLSVVAMLFLHVSSQAEESKVNRRTNDLKNHEQSLNVEIIDLETRMQRAKDATHIRTQAAALGMSQPESDYAASIEAHPGGAMALYAEKSAAGEFEEDVFDEGILPSDVEENMQADDPPVYWPDGETADDAQEDHDIPPQDDWLPQIPAE